MVQLTSKTIGLAISTLSVLCSYATAAVPTPGTYVITNVNFSGFRVFSGEGAGTVLPDQGFPVTADSGEFPLHSNSIFTLDSTSTTLFNEEAQQFAVVDASDGGSAGVGVILCNTTTPVAPFIPIGNSAWSLQEGSDGTLIFLSGRDLVWSIQAIGFGTQITLQPLNSSDLRQQWIFTKNPLL